MKKLWNHALGVGGVLVLAAAVILMTSDQSVAQNPNPGAAPVTIASPLPLPVREVGQVPVPYQQAIAFAQNPFTCSSLACLVAFNPVPAGYRLAIRYENRAAA